MWLGNCSGKTRSAELAMLNFVRFLLVVEVRERSGSHFRGVLARPGAISLEVR